MGLVKKYSCSKCGGEFESNNKFLHKMPGGLFCENCIQPFAREAYADIETECIVCKEKHIFPRRLREKICSEKCEIRHKELENERKQERINKQRISDIKKIIPRKFIDINFDSRMVEKYKGKSLFIHGNVGVGKTTLASSLAKEIIREDKGAKWINYTEFIFELQKAFRDKEKDPYTIAEDVALYGMPRKPIRHIYFGESSNDIDCTLFIDDFGAEKNTEFVNQMTYYIVNEREINELRTVITSNLKLNDINNIDARIASRIAGMCEIVELKGSDRRLSK